jgi:phosphatidylserine synthase
MSHKPSAAFDPRNLLTYVSLLCGIGGLAAARAGNASLAGFAIAVAVIADTFDGSFARRFGPDPARRALGVELDSLADAVAFGIAPPLCAGLLLNLPAGPQQAVLWGATFIYAACAITRLASYNVSAHSVGPLAVAREPLRRSVVTVTEAGQVEAPATAFIGLPVPVAALIWSSALLVHPSAAATTLLIVITAASMVLPLRVPRPTGLGLGLFIVWPLAVALLHAIGL